MGFMDYKVEKKKVITRKQPGEKKKKASTYITLVLSTLSWFWHYFVGCSKRPAIKIPPETSQIPKQVPYLLIGGGTASFSAFRAIKSADPTAKVTSWVLMYARPLTVFVILGISNYKRVFLSLHATPIVQRNLVQRRRWSG